MTLLQICQDVLNEIGSFEVPSSFVGNTNDTASQVLALANAAGKHIAADKDGGWQVQQIEHTLNTVADQEEYDFPAPLNTTWPIQATWWDRNNQWYMHGPVTPQKWQQLKAFVSSSSIRRSWRLRGDKVLIYPTPTTTGDPIVFEYVTDAWCSSSDGMTLYSRWNADTDLPLLDPKLFERSIKWRLLKEKGLPYDDDRNEFIDLLDKAKARDGGIARTHMTGAGWAQKYPIAHTPEGGWPG